MIFEKLSRNFFLGTIKHLSLICSIYLECVYSCVYAGFGGHNNSVRVYSLLSE